MIRKTITWMFVVVLLGGAAAGAYFYHYVTQSDELLLAAVQEAIQRVVPDWQLSMTRARFDFQGRIHLYDLKLRVDGSPVPLCEVPEAILVVDRERLAEPNPPVEQIRFLRAQLRLIQNPAGEWNWQQLNPPKSLDGAIPEFHVDQATVLVQPAGMSSNAEANTIHEVNLQLVPSGKRQFAVKMTGRMPHAEQTSLTGQWQIDTGVWNLAGQSKGLRVGPEVIAILRRFSPEFREATDQYAATLRTGTDSQPASIEAAPDLGITALADVGFRIQQWHREGQPQFQFSVNVLSAELAHSRLPVPLREIKGQIDCDERQIILKGFTAKHESSNVEVKEARVYKQGDLRPAVFELFVYDLPLDDRLRLRLPDSMRRVYDSVQPTGRVDLRLHLLYNGHNYWETEVDIAAKDCTARHVNFPYPVESVTGTLTQRGDTIDIDLRGLAGERQVTMKGRVQNPGPEAIAVLDIDTTGLPVDERFLNACPPGVRKMLEMLEARGELDGRMRLVRPKGLDQKILLFVNGRVRNGAILCRLFPYGITGLNGHIEHDGETWKVEGMQGRHEGAAITLSGSFPPPGSGPLQFNLNFTGKNVIFDERLLAALNEEGQAVWRELNPSGRFDVEGHLHHDADGVRHCNLEIDLLDAGVMVSSFPYALDKMRGHLSTKGHELEIRDLSARHGEVQFQVKEGSGSCDAGGKWKLRLDRLEIDDLEPDRQFRKTLPAELRTIVDTLDPRGKLSLEGMIEFKGRKKSGLPVTAAWDLETVYSGAAMTVGVDLRDMHGKSRFRGTWDGERVVGDGALVLNSVRIKNYQLSDVRGPFHMNGKQLIVGSEAAVNGMTPEEGAPPVRETDRLTAKFIDGKVALDALAALGNPLRYRVRLRFTKGELRKFAQLYLSGQAKLDGVINGWVDLYGEGADPKRLTGNGQILISPAALYELPVIIAIFKVLSFVPPDKTMFDQALFDFGIQNETFQFRKIDLVGNAINLVGRGSVRFDGQVGLDFFSTLGRNQLPIPIIREIVRETTKGWVGVQVRGTMKEPIVKTGSQIDDALRQLFGVPEARQPAPPQRR